MLFHEWRYLWFFLAVFVLIFSIPPRYWTARKVVLLLASYVFYMSWNAPFVLLLLLSTVIDYGMAKLIAREEPNSRRRLWFLLVSLCYNLGVLAIFKYGGFFTRNLGLFLPVPDGLQLYFATVILPMGISFYTFETVSYTIDVYRGERQPCRNLVEFALFISFFPHLVAGPILRLHEFVPQLRLPNRLTSDNVRRGAARFTIGLAKKMIFADVLGGFADQAFAAPGEMSTATLILAVYAFAFQIYLDFSAYTDMALGSAQILGFRLVENFDHPYVASSITDFWRRWHLSLSRWLRDYLYIPLGGNRGGAWRTYRNLMLTMLLGGLWHGANWTFVIWGGYHGLLLALERAWRGEARKEPPRGFSFQRGLGIVVTFHLVLISWFIFRVPDVATAQTFLQALVTNLAPLTEGELKVALLCGFLWLGHLLSHKLRLGARFVELGPIAQGAAIAVAVIMVAGAHTTGQPFIYFQF
jgi:alginate O-acetyltransferase complex protein AlgI